MLQPVQLQDVSIRYAAEIAELRDFLVKAGMVLGTGHSLNDVVVRLREDRGFRRDLTSHAWVVLHSGDPSIRYADLLGMLAVAAAGVEFAADAADTDAQALLRFLMEAKGSFETASVSGQRPPAADESGVGRFRRDVEPVAEPSLSLEMHEDSFDQRKVVWAGVAVCLLVVLGVGLLLHRHADADRAASVSAGPASIATLPNASANTEGRAAAPPSHGTATHVARRGPGVAPYSTVPETPPAVAETRSGVRSKPSPGTPMPTVTTSAMRPPVMESFKVLRNMRPSTAAKPAVVAGGDSRRVVVPGSLNTPVAPGRAGVDAVRQATVRPTSLGIMAANVMYSPAPAYPVAASAARIQGEVKLEAEIDRDGNVASTRVISGPPLLSGAAVDAVQRWRYRPYLYEGKPIAMNAMVVMDFQLP